MQTNKVVGIPFLNAHMKEFFKYLAYLQSYGHFILSMFPMILLQIPGYPTLRKIDGTETLPLGHRLMVRKTVPFRALFWCPFAKGH